MLPFEVDWYGHRQQVNNSLDSDPFDVLVESQAGMFCTSLNVSQEPKKKITKQKLKTGHR